MPRFKPIHQPFKSPALHSKIFINSPGLSDDAATGISHLDPGPEVDGIALVVGQAVLDHHVEVGLELAG